MMIVVDIGFGPLCMASKVEHLDRQEGEQLLLHVFMAMLNELLTGLSHQLLLHLPSIH